MHRSATRRRKVLEEHAGSPIRILGEYIHPLVQLKREGIGEHRSDVRFRAHRSHETAQTRCTRLKNTKTSKMSAAKLAKHRADVRHARSLLEMSRYYEEARQLSHKLTTWSLTLGPRPRRFVVCSAAARESWKQRTAERTKPAANLWIVDRVAPRAISKSLHQPGAQLQFQILFHAQTVVRADRQGLDRVSGRLRDHGRHSGKCSRCCKPGKLAKQNIILIYGRKYWDEVLNWKAMVRWGTINRGEYKMLQLPIPWTRPSITSAPDSKNITWMPTHFCRHTKPGL